MSALVRRSARWRLPLTLLILFLLAHALISPSFSLVHPAAAAGGGGGEEGGGTNVYRPAVLRMRRERGMLNDAVIHPFVLSHQQHQEGRTKREEEKQEEEEEGAAVPAVSSSSSSDSNSRVTLVYTIGPLTRTPLDLQGQVADISSIAGGSDSSGDYSSVSLLHNVYGPEEHAALLAVMEAFPVPAPSDSVQYVDSLADVSLTFAPATAAAGAPQSCWDWQWVNHSNSSVAGASMAGVLAPLCPRAYLNISVAAECTFVNRKCCPLYHGAVAGQSAGAVASYRLLWSGYGSLNGYFSNFTLPAGVVDVITALRRGAASEAEAAARITAHPVFLNYCATPDARSPRQEAVAIMPDGAWEFVASSLSTGSYTAQNYAFFPVGWQWGRRGAATAATVLAGSGDGEEGKKREGPDTATGPFVWVSERVGGGGSSVSLAAAVAAPSALLGVLLALLLAATLLLLLCLPSYDRGRGGEYGGEPFVVKETVLRSALRKEQPPLPPPPPPPSAGHSDGTSLSDGQQQRPRPRRMSARRSSRDYNPLNTAPNCPRLRLRLPPPDATGSGVECALLPVIPPMEYDNAVPSDDDELLRYSLIKRVPPPPPPSLLSVMGANEEEVEKEDDGAAAEEESASTPERTPAAVAAASLGSATGEAEGSGAAAAASSSAAGDPLSAGAGHRVSWPQPQRDSQDSNADEVLSPRRVVVGISGSHSRRRSVHESSALIADEGVFTYAGGGNRGGDDGEASDLCRMDM